MRSVVLLFIAGPLVAAPLREKPATPITVDNVQQLREAGTIPRDAWKLDWTPRTGALAVLPWENEIELFDAYTLKSLGKLAANRRLVHSAFSRDGEYLAWCENNSLVTIENLKTSKTVSFDTGSSQPDLAFHPNGKWLITGSGGVAKLWEVATGKHIRDFETDNDGGIKPVISPDGKILAVGNRNGAPRLFELETGKLLHVLPKRETQEVRFNPAGTILATAYVDGSIGLWDVVTGKSLHSVKTKGEELYTVDWSPKGDLLVTAGKNAKIIIWDAKELKPLRELDAPEWLIQARFSPDGSRLYTAGGTFQRSPDRKITVWGLTGER